METWEAQGECVAQMKQNMHTDITCFDIFVWNKEKTLAKDLKYLFYLGVFAYILTSGFKIRCTIHV